jgi:hypothetical protein
MPPLPEPSNLVLFTNIVALIFLILCYMFGVWLRSYVYPTSAPMPMGRQILIAIPVGFITMGLYAKSALPPLLQDNTGTDAAIAIGYAIFLGMLSRETLDKMLHSGISVGAGPADDVSLATPRAKKRKSTKNFTSEP